MLSLNIQHSTTGEILVIGLNLWMSKRTASTYTVDSYKHEALLMSVDVLLSFRFSVGDLYSFYCLVRLHLLLLQLEPLASCRSKQRSVRSNPPRSQDVSPVIFCIMRWKNGNLVQIEITLLYYRNSSQPALWCRAALCCYVIKQNIATVKPSVYSLQCVHQRVRMVLLSLNLNQLRTKEAPALQFESEPNPLCTSFSSRDALMNFICSVVWDLICYSYWMHKLEAESRSRNIFSSCFGVWRHNIGYKPVLNSRGDCEQFIWDIYGAKRGEGQKEEWFLGQCYILQKHRDEKRGETERRTRAGRRRM